MITSFRNAIVAAALGCLAVSPSFADDFAYPPPAASVKTLRLYATRYYVHYLKADSGPTAVQLSGHNGSHIGIGVSQKDFCFGALQGTIAFKNSLKTDIYNAAGLTSKPSTTCNYHSLSSADNAALGRQAWAKVTGNGVFGLGVRGLRLVPFRTVAVDCHYIPIGTVLYIADLRGFVFEDNGIKRVHDGYVIAGDEGRSVRGNHIDLFTGSYVGPPPGFVKSRANGLFNAEIVQDPALASKLKSEATYHP